MPNDRILPLFTANLLIVVCTYDTGSGGGEKEKSPKRPAGLAVFDLTENPAKEDNLLVAPAKPSRGCHENEISAE
jgi:hypothetical protein